MPGHRCHYHIRQSADAHPPAAALFAAMLFLAVTVNREAKDNISGQEHWDVVVTASSDACPAAAALFNAVLSLMTADSSATEGTACCSCRQHPPLILLPILSRKRTTQVRRGRYCRKEKDKKNVLFFIHFHHCCRSRPLLSPSSQASAILFPA